jgi:cytochrome c peroxidase
LIRVKSFRPKNAVEGILSRAFESGKIGHMFGPWRIETRDAGTKIYLRGGQMGIGRNMALTAGCLIVLAQATLVEAQAPQPDLNAVKRDYQHPPPAPIESKALVDLGRELFFDPQISASGKTACASCHVPELGWVVTDAHPLNDSGKPSSRKAQPLMGLGYAVNTPVGWDGRNPSLEAQAKGSITAGSMSMRETDAPVKVEVIEARIKSAPDYVARFNAALPGKPINIDTTVQAIAAFERTIEPGIAPFDRWADGDEAAISDSAKRGFALFTGKATCFACHSSWRFTDDQFHDIGTTMTDPGRGREVKDEALNFAFKTPTLRSVSLRAPYMHNASIATLEDVVKHYEKGGIARPSRSPIMLPIKLTDQERLDLVAFMETLTGNDDSARSAR